MVRLEKSLYEKVLNHKLFGRERIIASASKSNYIQPATYTMAQAYHMRYKHSYFQKAIAPLVDWCYKIFFWQYTRGELLQRGFVPDDFNHTETELRRGILRENILRESCHPYEQLFYRYRRLRYFKVDRIIQGFFVPDYVRKEVEKRTLTDAVVAKYEWDNFVHNNFMSDLTQSTYFGRGKFVLLEFLTVYGLWRQEAWERLFLNEKKYNLPSNEEMNEMIIKPMGLDLDTEDGRQEFESKVNKLINDNPGMVVPEGEKFNFQFYYACRAIQFNKNQSKFSAKELEEAKRYLNAEIDHQNSLFLGSGDEGYVGKNLVGKSYPRRLSKFEGKAFQN